MTIETLVQDDVMEGGFIAAEERRSIQWSSVIAGAFASAAMSFILVSFGVAIGLGVSSASPTWRDSSSALALLSVCALWPSLAGARAPTICGISFFTPDHVLFASDCPFDPEKGKGYIRDTIAVMESLDLPRADMEKIRYRNAERMFGLKPAREG